MNLTTEPLRAWLKPNVTWSDTDLRGWERAKRSGTITEQMADRLCIRYAKIQLEVIHPDYQP